MKKTAIIIILVSISFSAQSQLLYGPKVGFTSSNFSIKGPSPAYQVDKMKQGLLIGFYLRKQFPSEFFVQAQVDYRTLLGATFSGVSNTQDVGGPGLYLPVTFGSSISYNLDWYLGGAFGLSLDSENEGFLEFAAAEGYEGSIEETIVDIIIGLDFRLNKVVLDLSYHIALLPYYYTYDLVSFDSQELPRSQIVLTAGINLGNK